MRFGFMGIKSLKKRLKSGIKYETVYLILKHLPIVEAGGYGEICICPNKWKLDLSKVIEEKFNEYKEKGYGTVSWTDLVNELGYPLKKIEEIAPSIAKKLGMKLGHETRLAADEKPSIF